MTKRVVITLAQHPNLGQERLAKSFETLGLNIDRWYSYDVVIGSIEEKAIARLQADENVLSVREEQIIRLSRPDSPK